jgi:glycosyl hydrolase family 115
VYASDIAPASLHGPWSRTSDATAAAQIALLTPNLGVSNTSVPLASPTDYFEMTFTAPAATPYTIWLRLKAANNDKYNDSVWVQYSDAMAGGLPTYGINTTSALMVNLATDSSAVSLNAWGWQNTAYWLSQATTVTFATSGVHTLRVQTREDGVSIDQIVLSPGTYLHTPPGPPTGDSTTVPK